jgi:hypothetical protein
VIAPRDEAAPLRERDLIHEILLLQDRWPRCRLFRRNVGRAQHKSGSWVQYGETPGASDITGWIDGRRIEIEVKCGQTRTTRAQEAWIERAREDGCLAGVVRSVEEAVAVIEGNT